MKGTWARMSEELKLSPKEGEKFMDCITRAADVSHDHLENVIFSFDGANYVFDYSCAYEASQALLINDYVLRLVKRYCRDELNAPYKNATEEQKAAAISAVWQRINEQQLLPPDIIDAFCPVVKVKPLWQNHPNVAKSAVNVPPVNWRDVIDIQSVLSPEQTTNDAYGRFSAAQAHAIEQCLDQMVKNIPEFRLLISALNDPIIRNDMAGEDRPKLRICALDDSDHYNFHDHVVAMSTNYVREKMIDHKGNSHPLILQTLLAHELFHAADPLIVMKNRSEARGTSKWESEDTGSVTFERVVNRYYGLETRKDYTSASFVGQVIPPEQEHKVHWPIGTLDKSVQLPLTLFGGENRARVYEKLHQDLKLVQKHNYVPPASAVSLFSTVRFSCRNDAANGRG
jgi:hypothetical protein